MGDSREESPDWLRAFQPPSQSAVELSSGSGSPLDRSPGSDDEDGINLSKLFQKGARQATDSNDGRGHTQREGVKGKSPKEDDNGKQTPSRKRKREGESRKGKRAKGKDSSKRYTPEKHEKLREQNHSIWSLSSDSESCPEPITLDVVTKMELSGNEDDHVAEHDKDTVDVLLSHDRESPRNCTSKIESPMKNLKTGDGKPSIKKAISSCIDGESNNSHNIVKEDILKKHPGPQAPTSRVPLLLPEKVQLSKALVECEGDSIDLSGDVGAVGRIVISDDAPKDHEMLLDLKGTIYKATIVPSRTFCVVSFGQSEAKIEAIMNDYIQLKPQSNVYEAETMVEGTLDGFSFDSEDEAEKATVQADKNEAADEHPDTGTMRKPGKAATGVGRKKGKPAGGKLPKKVKKKPQVSKKSKSKK